MKSFDNIIRVIVLFVIHFQKDTCKRFIYTKLVHFNRRRFASDFKAKMEDRRLKSLSKEEQKKFLDSFDTVLCDVDGKKLTKLVINLIKDFFRGPGYWYSEPYRRRCRRCAHYKKIEKNIFYY